jgi:heptosyltransferase-1
MTTPAVSALRKALPHVHIAYIVENSYFQLVEGNPNIDEVLAIPNKMGPIRTIAFIRKIRREKYDAVIDFHSGPRASIITFFSKAKIRVGYRIKYRHFLYDTALPRSKEDGYFHSVENHLNLARTLGIRVDSQPRTSMPQATKKEREKVESFIRDNKLEDTRIVALHISAGNRFRDWGVGNLAALVTLFREMHDINIVLIGDREDKTAEQKIINQIKNPILTLVGRLSLRELREFISRCSLFIGPDSGPMHIAATTSTPIVALFGPTLVDNFAPWKAKTYILEKNMECRPCRQRDCVYEDFRCIQSISPDEVYQASLTFLKTHRYTQIKK